MSTGKPVACIADEVGYANLSHFNRQFLAIKDLMPREFRRSYSQKEPLLGADGLPPLPQPLPPHRRPQDAAEAPTAPVHWSGKAGERMAREAGAPRALTSTSPPG